MYTRHTIDANHNSHAMSVMLHVAGESALTWQQFDEFLHRCMPSLREKKISIVMYGVACQAGVVQSQIVQCSAVILGTVTKECELALRPPRRRRATMPAASSSVLTRTDLFVRGTAAKRWLAFLPVRCEVCPRYVIPSTHTSSLRASDLIDDKKLFHKCVTAHSLAHVAKYKRRMSPALRKRVDALPDSEQFRASHNGELHGFLTQSVSEVWSRLLKLAREILMVICCCCDAKLCEQGNNKHYLGKERKADPIDFLKLGGVTALLFCLVLLVA